MADPLMDGIKDVIDAGHTVGLPTWVLAGLFLMYVVGKEFRVLSRFGPRKSERELLSADQETFRSALMKRITSLQDAYDQMAKHHEACERKSADCEARCDALNERLHAIMSGIKASGIDFLMKLAELDAPLPVSNPQRLSLKKRLWP